jgi:hypothetical protein
MRETNVERDDANAKFWLDPVRLARSVGFSSSELNRIEGMIVQHEAELLRAWNEFFER